MQRSKLPSILSFSTILCYYGGKLEMRRLLFCLAKGGRTFFNDKVKNGHFFKVNVINSNLIHLNAAVLKKYFLAKEIRSYKIIEETKDA